MRALWVLLLVVGCAEAVPGPEATLRCVTVDGQQYEIMAENTFRTGVSHKSGVGRFEVFGGGEVGIWAYKSHAIARFGPCRTGENGE